MSIEIDEISQFPSLQESYHVDTASDQSVLENSPRDPGSSSAEPTSSDFSDPETSSDEFENSMDSKKASEIFLRKWLSTKAATRCPHATAKSFYKTVYENRKLLPKMGDKWIHYRTGRRKLDEELPKIVSDHYFRDLREDIPEFVITAESFPERQYGNSAEYRLQKTWTRVKLAEALTYCDQAHGRMYASEDDVPWRNKSFPPVEIDISMDGVPLDNSSIDVMEVLSFKKTDCVRVFPLAIHIGYGKEKDTKIMFGKLIEELADLNVKVRFVLADSPQRAALLNVASSNGYWSCIKCEFQGEKNPSKFGAKVVWTSNSIGCKRRTHKEWLANAKKARQFGSIKGINGETALNQLVSDLDKQIPLDTFHVLYLGMVKRMVKNVLQLKKDGKPSAVMKEVKKLIDANLPLLHYPSEFSRDPRPIETPHYKSSEWRNLVTVAFDVVTQSLLRLHQRPTARVWEYFVFLVRGLQLDNNMFTDLKQAVNLHDIMSKFYKLYTKEFKPGSCAPTVHMFYHLLDQRETGSVAEHSTEVFESFYGLVKQSYHPGTKSMGKQIMESIYTYYSSVQNHSCQRRLRLKPKGKGKRDDSLVYTQSGFYVLKKRIGHGLFRATKLETKAYKSDVCPELPFHKVLVFQESRLGTMSETIRREDVIAKAVRCNDLISMVPPDALFCSNN